jgi:tRNA threonylcarbamoyladenosine biosynthesis protein TsaE
MKEVIIRDESELVGLIPEISGWIGDNLVVCLLGEMGAGKTTLVRHFMESMGSAKEVASPTFAIIHEYVLSGAPWPGVYHMDLYRLNNIAEVRALPLSDYLDSGKLCLIEWPQVAADELPDDIKVIRIERLENGSRKFVFL